MGSKLSVTMTLSIQNFDLEMLPNFNQVVWAAGYNIHGILMKIKLRIFCTDQFLHAMKNMVFCKTEISVCSITLNHYKLTEISQPLLLVEQRIIILILLILHLIR